MQLLVSVADAVDASAAVDGGADIIDAKDPSRGPLGAVAPATLAAIIASVAGRRPVSAALGDGADAPVVSLARVAFAKLDVGAVAHASEASAEVCGCAIVLAAYADRCWHDVIAVAEKSGAHGVLLDTSDKDGPGLFGLIDEDAIGRWVETAHRAGLVAAIAGRLTAEDLPRAAALGADIAGVRGAACDGGRGGRVSAERVRALARVAASVARRAPGGVAAVVQPTRNSGGM